MTVPFWVAGLDEAGRGPLAGPVVAAAVVLHPARPIPGLADSKTLSAARREHLAVLIREQAQAWALGMAEAEEIDRCNILQASLLAMQRAYAALSLPADLALVDGNQAPELPCEVRTIVRGDATQACISAASILAKTVRDARMQALHARFPQYGFDRHMGYPTTAHLAALRRHGPSPEHRRSFRPVRELVVRPVI
jgi:ribonuclease HII